jgi:hypothetical protein
MRELVVKKHEELKEIRRRARLPEDDTTVMVFDAMDSGMIWCCWWSNMRVRVRLTRSGCVSTTADAERAMILERLELQISKAKDLEFSRKDVLEKMDRWQAALEEESWLEEYSRVRRLDRQTHHLYPLLHNPIRLLLVAEREQIQHRQRDAPRAQARGESTLPGRQNAGYV